MSDYCTNSHFLIGILCLEEADKCRGSRKKTTEFNFKKTFFYNLKLIQFKSFTLTFSLYSGFSHKCFELFKLQERRWKIKTYSIQNIQKDINFSLETTFFSRVYYILNAVVKYAW